MVLLGVILLISVAASSAYVVDPIISKLDEDGPRYQYVRDSNGVPHLVDLWMKLSDFEEMARFNPDVTNNYHLFTRQNPTVSQPMVISGNTLLGAGNFNRNRRTIVVLHGWRGNANANSNSVLVPAFLASDDVNVIVVDWRAGADTINYAAAVGNTITSGASVARWLNALNVATGATPNLYHIIGFSLGGHKAGIIGRQINGNVAYITALEPALPGWLNNDQKFRSSDGVYTEVIHTNVGVLGYMNTLGHVDFYPNGGRGMPGCNGDTCDHDMCYHYMAESLRSGGFTGRRCASVTGAMTNNCVLPGSLQMGGRNPKTGASGIFRVDTNASPPFSRG